MGRTADKKSTRQLAFAMLDKLTNMPRQDALVVLMDEFNIKKPYANTIYQHHRKMNKEDGGNLIPAYKILDVKNGYSVDPFLSKRYVNAVGDDEDTTIAKAISRYTDILDHKRSTAVALLSES